MSAIFATSRRAAMSILGHRSTQCLSRNLPMRSPISLTIIRGIQKPRSHPKNSQIPYDIVQVMDDDGTLHHAEKLDKILQNIDTATHTVRLVNDSPPTVRIFSRMEEKLHKVELRLDRKTRESKHKVVQKVVKFSWFVSGHDFDRLVEKARDSLLKGLRVDINFTHKRGRAYPKPNEQQEQMQRVADMLQDVGEEWRDRDLKGSYVRLFFQSRTRQKAMLPTQEDVKQLAMQELEQTERAIANTKRRAEDRKKLAETWVQSGLDPSIKQGEPILVKKGTK